MNKNKPVSGIESEKDMNKNHDPLVNSLQQQFKHKSEDEIIAAIEIAGPDQKDVENYLSNPVNGEGFTPSH